MGPRKNKDVFFRLLTKTTIKSSFSQYIIAGQITSTHGLKGELFISSNASLINVLASTLLDKPVQIKKNDSLLFEGSLGNIRPHKTGLITQIQSVSNLLEAENFKGAQLWVKRELFISRVGEDIYLSEILGFAVYDKNYGFIGHVSSFSDNGSQDILIVKNQNSGLPLDVLFIPEFVMHIDFNKSSLFLDLPLQWPGL